VTKHEAFLRSSMIGGSGRAFQIIVSGSPSAGQNLIEAAANRSGPRNVIVTDRVQE
jgi:hypothetical protein